MAKTDKTIEQLARLVFFMPKLLIFLRYHYVHTLFTERLNFDSQSRMMGRYQVLQFTSNSRNSPKRSWKVSSETSYKLYYYM